MIDMSIPKMIEELEIEEMPEGFAKISLLVTSSELRNLRHVANITGEGTYSAAIRRALRWPESPYGLKACLARLIEAKRADAKDVEDFKLDTTVEVTDGRG